MGGYTPQVLVIYELAMSDQCHNGITGWHSSQVEGLVGFISRAGSSPVSGTQGTSTLIPRGKVECPLFLVPLLARIVAVPESFDALIFDTPYRRAIPVEKAFAELEKQQGEQFDPHVVTAFLQVREKVVEEMSRLENQSDKGDEVLS
jgi:hypothetical protein